MLSLRASHHERIGRCERTHSPQSRTAPVHGEGRNVIMTTTNGASPHPPRVSWVAEMEGGADSGGNLAEMLA